MKIKNIIYTALIYGISNALSIGAIAQLGILNVNANGGINPATGLAWQRGDTYRLAFVTSGTITATSTDIATYNAFVQNAAAGSSAFSNLNKVQWNAMVSTSTVNVRTNTGTASGTGEAIFLLNSTTSASTVFANNYADLWDGNANLGRLRYTENGDLRQGNYPNTPSWGSWTAVWTGSTGTGATSSALGSATVRHGLVNAEQQFWMNRSTTTDTSQLFPVYALSATLQIVPEPSSSALTLLGAVGLCLRRRR